MLDGIYPFGWPTIAGKRRPRRDIPCDASLAHAAGVAHCHSYRVLRLGALGGDTWYERRACLVLIDLGINNCYKVLLQK